jgi:hypothetical protein
MHKGSEWGEKWLIRFVLLGVCTLLLTQMAMFKEEARHYLSRVDRLEGEKVSLDSNLYASNSLTISERTVVSKQIPSFRESRNLIVRMIKPAGDARAFATINGEKMSDFSRGEVNLTVYDGDYVEIDCAELKAPAQFVVTVSGGSMTAPVDGLVVETKNNIGTIGKIKFK